MKALILIDIQNGSTKRKGLFRRSLFFDTINKAINRYRGSSDMLIFTKHNNKQLVMDAEDWKIDKRIKKINDDITLQKQYADAFKNEELNAILKKK